ASYATLHARDGVLAIPGNHEYYADYRGWMAAYDRLGLPMLANRRMLITRGADSMAVAGLTDRQSRGFGEPPPDLDAALAGIPPGVPVILLDHQPVNARANAAAGVGLQLSGHTHGGQIPGIAVITRRANHGFISGLYQVGTMQLYVSNGTGLWNGLILRLGHPSEITELVLYAPDPGHAERVAARQGVAAQPAA
ncbi:MAG: metallophosphoesterase, partial [Rhodanobacteraceae bacterium]